MQPRPSMPDADVSYLGVVSNVPERAGYGNDVGKCDESGPSRPAEVFVSLDVHVCIGELDQSSNNTNGMDLGIAYWHSGPTPGPWRELGSC